MVKIYCNVVSCLIPDQYKSHQKLLKCNKNPTRPFCHRLVLKQWKSPQGKLSFWLKCQLYSVSEMFQACKTSLLILWRSIKKKIWFKHSVFSVMQIRINNLKTYIEMDCFHQKSSVLLGRIKGTHFQWGCATFLH